MKINEYTRAVPIAIVANGQVTYHFNSMGTRIIRDILTAWPTATSHYVVFRLYDRYIIINPHSIWLHPEGYSASYDTNDFVTEDAAIMAATLLLSERN